MRKINKTVYFVFFLLLFCNCNGQYDRNDICKKKFKKARELAYSNPCNVSALETSLSLTNECMQCDSIRKVVVDFKINLLISMKKFTAGINFIDSLSENDLAFPYKKNLFRNNFQALEFASKKDTINRNLVYEKISRELEHYIQTHKITNKEFKEIYTEMFIIKDNYLDANQINIDVENLIRIYPEQKPFFDFFKK
ncbi:MAG: hypothetical protein ABIR78_02415 [Ferruginibacter sp.]